MDKSKENTIIDLLNLIDTHKKSKVKIDLLNKIETINGYDLVFILSLIIRNNYSGNLIIINEEDLMSSITFIYGDIVKLDFPDQEYMLGKIIVDSEVLSNFEMQEIIKKCQSERLGEFLIENKYLTPQQLRKFLFKQSILRIAKYLSSLSIRVKFTFESVSNDSVLISKVDYLDILNRWIFENFEDAWLENYATFYQKNSFVAEVGPDNLQFFKDYPDIYDVAFKISQLKKTGFTYNEIFKIAHKTRQKFLKILHFLILSGIINVVINKETRQEKEAAAVHKADLLEHLDSDLKKVQDYLLNKKYFIALGLLNKYSSFIHVHPTVTMYFIWIKLIGAYYNNHLIDIKKIAQDFYEVNYIAINAGEFYYVQSLLLRVQKKDVEANDSYQKATDYNELYKKYPINKDGSFINRMFKIVKNTFFYIQGGS